MYTEDPAKLYEDRDLIHVLCKNLRTRERYVVAAKIGNATFKEIAKEIGVSPARTCQIYQKALSKARAEAKKHTNVRTLLHKNSPPKDEGFIGRYWQPADAEKYPISSLRKAEIKVAISWLKADIRIEFGVIKYYKNWYGPDTEEAEDKIVRFYDKIRFYRSWITALEQELETRHD